MRVIFTADWQAEFDNLDLCFAAHREIMSYCEQYDVRTVVHCGDLKRPYNPLDGRMVNKISEIVREYGQNGISPFFNLGNHDRFGLYTDKENWLAVIRNAGALAFDEPKIVRPSGGVTGGKAGGLLAFLPFRQSTVLLKREAHDLARAVRNHKFKSDGVVLVFHCDLNLARYNVKTSSTTDMTVDDLYPEEYLVCVGGHIHLPQKVSKNVYYVGSPFATDWGESNQIKSYLMFDYETRKVTRLLSKIPRMLDEMWPGFREASPKDWRGAKVRIHVSCNSSTDIFSVLRKEELVAQRKYPGAEIVPVIELEAVQETKVKLRAQDSDEQKIKMYLEQTLPGELVQQREKTSSYLLSRLVAIGAQVRTNKIKFIDSVAENFLCFQRLKIKYEPGLTVVSGINEDRRGKSNGSGKTSFLSPPAVALFGSTFKGQKYDHWMYRWAKKDCKCYVATKFIDSENRVCRVVRGRKPRVLRAWIGGIEVAGGNRPEQIQEHIEKLTGFTWETLSGAMFVDQRKTNLMLTGTESERKSFLSRLQGLDRFEKALVDVKEDFAAAKRKEQELHHLWELEAVRMEEHSNELLLLQKETPNVEELKTELAKKVEEITLKKKKFIQVKARGVAKTKFLSEHYEQIVSKNHAIELRVAEVNGRISSIGSKLIKFSNLQSQECPTCEQPIDREQMDSVVERLNLSLSKLNAEKKALVDKSAICVAMLPKIRKKIADETAGEEELEDWIREAVEELATAKASLRVAEIQSSRIQSMKKILARSRDLVNLALTKVEKARKSLPVYEYCVAAFSRKGMPAFLNAQLCPLLNRASAYYSQMFSEKEIQVVFSVDENGESDVRVVNVNGGSEVSDQSQGEIRIASLITSFALRHVAPQTNLLILDEPGEGLDPLAARTFARGLKEAATKFGSVFVVTHNQAILSELAGARHLVIRKKNRVSTVEVQDGRSDS